MRTSRRLLALVAGALFITLAACGGGGGSTGGGPVPGVPVSTWTPFPAVGQVLVYPPAPASQSLQSPARHPAAIASPTPTPFVAPVVNGMHPVTHLILGLSPVDNAGGAFYVIPEDATGKPLIEDTQPLLGSGNAGVVRVLGANPVPQYGNSTWGINAETQTSFGEATVGIEWPNASGNVPVYVYDQIDLDTQSDQFHASGYSYASGQALPADPASADVYVSGTLGSAASPPTIHFRYGFEVWGAPQLDMNGNTAEVLPSVLSVGTFQPAGAYYFPYTPDGITVHDAISGSTFGLPIIFKTSRGLYVKMVVVGPTINANGAQASGVRAYTLLSDLTGTFPF